MKTIDRFEAKLALGDFQENLGSPCWRWLGEVVKKGHGAGYGKFYAKAYDTNVAHRWSYEYHVAPVPHGLELDHLCRVRDCVNPYHLEPVSHAENMRRARKSHCKWGHPLSGDNLRLQKVGTYFARECRTCKRENQRPKDRRR